jgi:H+/gluconate symporter-like permease
MDGVLIVVGALALLVVAAYRGHSVILVAPLVALLAVLCTAPDAVPVVGTGLYMDKLATFAKSYFPVFLLGAVFGRLIARSGAAAALVAALIALVGARRAMLSVVAVCALLTYGGVSLFVVVFAVQPFATLLFRRADIPRRLIPGTVVLGAFSFTMDALPGTPQIQNLIPTTFFATDAWAAPWLGTCGAVVIAASGLAWLEWRRRQAQRSGEGYGEDSAEPVEPLTSQRPMHPLVALLPLLVVGVANKLLTTAIPQWFGATASAHLAGLPQPLTVAVQPLTALWAVEGALVLGILVTVALAGRALATGFAENLKPAVAGALLATMNTASEYGFGAVIAALPGFVAIRGALQGVHDPLASVAISVATLSGVTGSASGGLSIALAALAERFLAAAHEAGIPPEVLHRVAAMASGGMDTLPHNGAVITLLAVCGLTHRQAYRDIFAITCIKTAAVLVVIGVYRCTGLV